MVSHTHSIGQTESKETSQPINKNGREKYFWLNLPVVCTWQVRGISPSAHSLPALLDSLAAISLPLNWLPIGELMRSYHLTGLSKVSPSIGGNKPSPTLPLSPSNFC